MYIQIWSKNMVANTMRSSIFHWLLCTVLLLVLLTNTVTCQCSSTNKQATENLVVNETISVFSTPGYRVAYYSQMDCKWIFDSGTTGATIVFDITEVMIESSRNCRYDALTIYQGSGTGGTVVNTLCGRYYSGTYVTVTDQYATLQLTADRSRQYAGASMKVFYAQDQSGSACSGTSASLTASTTTQYLTSPGYPVTLANGVDCSWTITGSAATVLYLAVMYSDMEYDVEMGGCMDQLLTLYDGSSASDPALVEAWCDSRDVYPSQQTVYYTTGNAAYVRLVTSPESIASRHGFRLDYRQNASAITVTTTVAPTTTELVQVCSSVPTILEANTTWQYFRTLNYPDDYPNNANCYWQIEAPVGYTLNLTFYDSNVQDSENCVHDAVTVYDGRTSQHPLASKFCGDTAPSLASTGRYLYVNFKTDPTIVYRGFSAQYRLETAAVPACVVANITANYTASDTVQTIESPGYPAAYNNSLTLYWMIANPNETQRLMIEVEDSRIEGSVDCQYDSVHIYQGPCTSYPLLGQFCGVDRPSYDYDTGSYALVVMTTDDTVAFKGFKINFYLTDAVDGSVSKYIIGGIIAGSVLGGLALIGGAGFGVYKYLKSKNRLPGSASTSRSSSRSSLSEAPGPDPDYTGGSSTTQQPRRLPPIQEYVPGNIYA